jgi:suppressor for copper-sensitivity B
MDRVRAGFVRVCGLAAVCLLAVCPVASVSHAADDPLAAINAALGSPVRIAAAIEPGTAGGPDVLAVTATLEPGWHLYSLTQKPGGPRPTTITITADSPRRIAGGFEPDVPPDAHAVDDIPSWKGLVVEEHAGRVTWRAALEPAAAGGTEVRGSVNLQLCRDGACLPPDTIGFTATPAGGAGSSATPAAAGPTATHQPERSHATITAGFGPRQGTPDKPVWPLRLSVEPEPDWHAYAPAASAVSEIGQGKPTIAALAETQAATLVSASAGKTQAPHSAELQAAGAVEGPVTLELALAPADAGGVVDVLLGFQTCSETTCDPPTGVRLTLKLPQGDDPATGGIEFADARYAEAAQAPAPLTLPAAAADDPPALAAAQPAIGGQSASTPLTLPAVLLMGLAGGLILNLMPCVLPVLGLKLMSFAQQSGRARREVFEMNLWYCAGLYAVFFALATASVAANIGLGGSNLAWGEQFTSASFNIAMLGIVFAFGLSFLGIWELPIPGFIGEQAGHVQTREGPMGAFLKGVLSTVLATPCSGPFLGPVFGFTLTQSTAVTYVVFGSIATGMALPYILVGLVPGLVKFLPKPGAWMGTFKEVLGFVMLGTVVYLFTFLNSQWFVPTLAMLIGIWMACWWVGRAQERQGAVGFGRWVQAAALASVIGTAAFMFLGPVKKVIEWEQPFTRARLAELREQGSTVMVDFSADWCPTCKFNLATAIETTRVKAAVEKNRVVPVLADWTDGSLEIKQMLESLQSKSIPLLAIFPAAKPGGSLPEPIVLRDLITESQVLEALDRAGPSCCPPPEIRAASAGAPTAGR